MHGFIYRMDDILFSFKLSNDFAMDLSANLWLLWITDDFLSSLALSRVVDVFVDILSKFECNMKDFRSPTLMTDKFSI